MLRKSKKKQKLLTKESIIHKTANKFVTYGGYIPELDMVLNDGYYFKTYVLDEINTGGILHEMALHDKTMENEQSTSSKSRKYQMERILEESFLKPVFHYPGLKIQMIASGKHIYGVFGIKAEIAEDALETFRTFEQAFPYPPLTCEEWFSIMADRLRF